MDWRETIKSDGGEGGMPAVEPRKGMSDKGGEYFPSLPYGRGHKWEKGLRKRE